MHDPSNVRASDCVTDLRSFSERTADARADSLRSASSNYQDASDSGVPCNIVPGFAEVIDVVAKARIYRETYA